MEALSILARIVRAQASPFEVVPTVPQHIWAFNTNIITNDSTKLPRPPVPHSRRQDCELEPLPQTAWYMHFQIQTPPFHHFCPSNLCVSQHKRKLLPTSKTEQVPGKTGCLFLIGGLHFIAMHSHNSRTLTISLAAPFSGKLQLIFATPN